MKLQTKKGVVWLKWILVGLDIVVSAVIALLADRIFSNDSVAQVVRVVLPFVGFSAALTVLLLEMRLDLSLKVEVGEQTEKTMQAIQYDTKAQLEGFAKTLEQQAQDLHKLLPAFNFYFQSAMLDPFGFRSRVLDEAVGRLRRIADGELELDDTLYYEWLTARLRQRPRTVKAVNVRPLRVFETDPQEDAFLRENHNAIEQGTKISRIYVLRRTELHGAEERRILLGAYKSKVMCHVAWQEEISDPLLKMFSGGGISIYDDGEVFLDRSYFRYAYVGGESEPRGHARLEATVFRHPHPQFRALERAYAQLMDHFVPVQRPTAELAFADVLTNLLRKSSGLDPKITREIQMQINQLEKKGGHS